MLADLTIKDSCTRRWKYICFEWRYSDSLDGDGGSADYR